jgi:HEPN domain-containing protein
MPEHDRLEDYLTAGPKRLADARELLERPTLDAASKGAETRHLRGAMYLAGYAVECALKAYIIDRASPSQTFTEAVEALSAGLRVPLDFRGARAHNLGLLLRATDLDGRMGEDFLLRAHWGVCLTWSPAWRYDPRDMTQRSRARQTVEAAAAIFEWVNDERLRPLAQGGLP